MSGEIIAILGVGVAIAGLWLLEFLRPMSRPRWSNFAATWRQDRYCQILHGYAPNGLDDARWRRDPKAVEMSRFSGGSGDMNTGVCPLPLVQKARSLAHSRLLAFILVVTPLTGTVLSQDTAAELRSQALAAHGGTALLGAIRDVVSEGTLTFYGAEGPRSEPFQVIIRRRGSKAERAITQPAGIVREGTDGVRTWHSFEPAQGGGAFQAVAQGPTLQYLERLTTRSVDRLLASELSYQVWQDRQGDGALPAIEALDRDGRRTLLQIDFKTGLVRSMKFETVQQNSAIGGGAIRGDDRYIFHDYRDVGGMMTPFIIERFTNGAKTEELRLNSVSFNTDFSDAVFVPPVAARQ